MNDAAIVLRHQRRVEELCAATIRALGGDPGVYYREGRLHSGATRLQLYAPHLHPCLETDDFASFRGAADGVALRLLHCDTDLHESLCPRDPIARLVFELLEQFRVETLGDASMSGVTANLEHRHREWSLAFHRSGQTETARGLLLYAVAQICRARLTGEPVVAETECLIESTRFALGPLLGDNLAGLRRHRDDQRSYAVHALSIARTVANMVQDAGALEHNDELADDDDRTTALWHFTLWQGFDEGAEDSENIAATGGSAALSDTEGSYRVFTTAYDEQHRAASLVRPEVLKSYREQLDREIANQGINVFRLARQLTSLLAEPTRNGWDSGREEGHVDGRRLAQLISAPEERRLFRVERVEPVPSALVTFLVDCSGSMKEHATSVAILVDVFARALEQAGAGCEILGFTTGAWSGGRARRDWLRAGRPPHPGRLNEICHLVFKDAESSWRRERPGIAALLKPDLYREGIDGEAVTWACGRSESREEHRRLLIVVSDGSPMDSATDLANDHHYLDHHVQTVVAHTEQRGAVEIYGVGVGLDLSPYYRHSRVLDLSRAKGNTPFSEVVDLVASAQGR